MGWTKYLKDDQMELLRRLSIENGWLEIDGEPMGNDEEPIGIPGPKGDKGDQGDTGPQGDPGPTGSQGPKGDIGSTGPKGDTGLTGATGPKGDAGATGPAGAKGDTGAAGATGSQGTAGAAGDSRVKYRSIVDVTAQSAGSFTLAAINLGANVFTNRPVVSVDIECSSGVITARHVITGAATTGFVVTITLNALKSSLDISLGALLGISLLAASIPALKLHIIATEP